MNGPTLAVFASDKGPGDAERSNIMTQAGLYFARHGATIVCVAENGVIPVPLVTAARTAGGNVRIIADGGITLPKALAGVRMDVVTDPPERMQLVASLADALVALPGSLASASALFGAWSASKGLGKLCPVVMLNRHRAFEVIRGYAADVLSPGLPGHERSVQFADTIEDLWSRVSRLVSEAK
jgi:predicted Rossmann-fold nucleotide-binding protein